MMPSDKRKDEEAAEASPFEGLQKNAVLHEARLFHDPHINPPACARVITKLLYLITQGEEFSSTEASEVFFSVTKLFQSQDIHLRRLIYLIIKELDVGSGESLIVVSCLSKDMVSKIDLFRSNAIRVLARIIDASMLGQIDRFLKQAVVDRDPFVVSSALVAGIHLYPTAPEVVKRWVTEVQEALNSPSKMVQFHALTLLYKIKQHDRLAISKVVASLCKNPPKSPLAHALLLRYAAGVTCHQSPHDPQIMQHLKDSLHNKSFAVMYEAARALCKLPNADTNDLQPAVLVLQEFLASPVATQRLAAVRTLSEVVLRFPSLVSSCNNDLERLITDANRSVATLAITTLLKSGAESNVDRLLKSITGFIAEISDEFKMVLVDAIKVLCLKFPHKHPSLMGFLSTALREEGGKDYKTALVTALLEIIAKIPEAKEAGLDHFCEFIEDCEFPDLLIKILHLIGEEGPRTSNPARYIRYIFNRIILECASVRAAAVSTLAKFACSCADLKPSICKLLEKALKDNDDEVRDRAVLYLAMLREPTSLSEEEVSHFICDDVGVPLADLELSLTLYTQKPHQTPFNLEKHLVAAEEREEEIKQAEEEKKKEFSLSAPAAAVAPAAGVVVANPYLELLESVAEFKDLGPLFRSTEPVQLTEDESEYQVTCIKHIYPHHVVFQFSVTNTMDDQLLEKVTVEMSPSSDAWTEELLVPESKIDRNSTGTTFVCLQRPESVFSCSSIECELRFVVKDVDVSAGVVSDEGVEDTYQLEEVEVVEKDFMRPGQAMSLVEFRRQWESLADIGECVKKYSLASTDLQRSVDAVVDLLGMRPCENSGVVPEDKQAHAINLYGTWLGDIPVFARAGFMRDPKHGVQLKIALRSPSREVSELLINCIH